MTNCERCPCPGVCSRHPAYCSWAAREPRVLREIKHICDASAARAGRRYELPPAVADQCRPAGLARELVISRYREDVRWADSVGADFFLSIYDKGGDPTLLARPHRLVRLPNLGREAHSMLWHIVHNYDRLADWTYFVQGDADFHAPDILGRLLVEYTGLCSLTETYSPTHPPAETHKLDRVEWVGGYRVAYGDAEADLAYGAAHPPTGNPWFNPAAWTHVFACPPPRPLYFGYAAQWAVPRANITSRPREFWAWLLSEVERSPWHSDGWSEPPVNPWAVEALWLYLLSDPETYPHREPAFLPETGELDSPELDSPELDSPELDSPAGEPVVSQYPPLLRQAGNALVAAGRVLRAAAQGEQLTVGPAEYERRLAICRDCDQFDRGPQRCRLCGCYTTLKLKLASEHCPLEPAKW